MGELTCLDRTVRALGCLEIFSDGGSIPSQILTGWRGTLIQGVSNALNGPPISKLAEFATQSFWCAVFASPTSPSLEFKCPLPSGPFLRSEIKVCEATFFQVIVGTDLVPLLSLLLHVPKQALLTSPALLQVLQGDKSKGDAEVHECTLRIKVPLLL